MTGAIHQAFAQAGAALAQRRHAGAGAAMTAPDWLCADAVAAIALPLLPCTAPALHVVLRDGVPGRAVPRRWTVSQSIELPIRLLRAPLARAQSTPPPLLTLARTSEVATATALVRDRLNPERHYLLTCGHAVAPDPASRFGDRVRIDSASVGLDGRLREWQPNPGSPPPTSRLDAALVEVDAGTLQALRERGPGWLPRGLDDAVWADRPVSVQRQAGPLEGRVLMHWSGEVGAAGQARAGYFLEDGLAYLTDSPTVGGDSGAALWVEGEALLGMHIGALQPGGAMTANAVMARVKPALDWYCVKPFTRLDPATLGLDDWPAFTAAPGAVEAMPGQAAEPAVVVDGSAFAAGIDARELQVLAQTLWGEARGEGFEGMKAVAAVVMNRARSRYRGKADAAGVCLDPWQFSCWNGFDPNRDPMQRIAANPDPEFRSAISVAEMALSGRLVDPTHGSRHYVATSLRQRPSWLSGKEPVVVIGRHAFYNDIA